MAYTKIQDLIDLVEDFPERGLAVKTMAAYKARVNRFLDFLANGNSPVDLEKAVENYLKEICLSHTQSSYETIRSTLNIFCNYVRERKGMDVDLVKKVTSINPIAEVRKTRIPLLGCKYLPEDLRNLAEKYKIYKF